MRMGEEVMRGGYSERTGCMSVSAHLEQQPMDGRPEEDQGQFKFSPFALLFSTNVLA